MHLAILPSWEHTLVEMTHARSLRTSALRYCHGRHEILIPCKIRIGALGLQWHRRPAFGSPLVIEWSRRAMILTPEFECVNTCTDVTTFTRWPEAIPTESRAQLYPCIGILKHCTVSNTHSAKSKFDKTIWVSPFETRYMRIHWWLREIPAVHFHRVGWPNW